jgi:polysaccharide biosynthesis/export protein
MKTRNAAVMVMALALGAGLVLGCGGSAAQLQPEQILSQVDRVKSEQDRQQLLPAATSRGSVGHSRDYAVGPEDLLEVQLFGQNNLDRQVRVSGQGEITLPLVGEVQVAGLSPKSIEARLKDLYGSNYLRNPQVSVAVKEYRHQRVSVTGAVDKPGSYEIIGPRNLLEVLAMAGGLQDKGSAKAGDMVHIIRNQSAYQTAKVAPAAGAEGETTIIDLKQLLAHKTSELNVPIRHGDVVHVPLAGNAYVVGAVRKPGSVAVRDNLSLSQALAMAGGVDPVLAVNQVAIMRLDEHGKPATITARLDRVFGKQEADVPLKDNDVVVVNVGNLKKHLYVFKQLLPGGSSTAAYRAAP